MSGPLNLTTEQLRKLGSALDAMADITRTHGVDLAPHGRQHLGIDDNVLAFSWAARRMSSTTATATKERL